ncbi:MAG: glycosyltransferase family 2 protein [Bacteroidota bacterium]
MVVGDLVSIITPTYNHAPYIGACIDRVKAQRYPHWELFVLDDGSPDGTAAVAERHADGDSRIHVWRREHKGPERLVELYNHGLERSRGAFVAILEGDDYWPDDKLQVQLQAFEPDAVMSFGLCRVVQPDEAFMYVAPRISTVPTAARSNRPAGAALHELLRLHNFVPAVTAMVRRDALERIGGFQSGHGMVQVDLATWCHLALEGPFQFIDHELGFWRRHEHSITTTRVAQMARSRHRFMTAFLSAHRARIEALIELDEAQLTAAWAHTMHPFGLLWKQGRRHMIFGEFSAAQTTFLAAMKEATTATEWVRATVAWLASTLRVDLLTMARSLINSR